MERACRLHGTATVTISASDNFSGVRSASLRLRTDDGDTITADVDLSPGSRGVELVFEFHMGGSQESGRYRLNRLDLTDYKDNARRYISDSEDLPCMIRMLSARVDCDD